MRDFLLAFGLLFLLSNLAACAPLATRSAYSPWEYGDLRLLSPAGAGDPSLDLIAAYTRSASNDLQFRFDLLELDPETPFDLYLALDTSPGGTFALPIDATTSIEWDTLLVLPAVGNPQAYTASPAQSIPTPSAIPGYHHRTDLIPRISRIPWQDTIFVSINRNLLKTNVLPFRVQAFLSPAGSRSIADNLGPFRSDSFPPARAPVLIEFWNTFPAYTPAQALRRWDGAHTGPFGERHGLHVLLQNVRRTKVPVALLDLKTPNTLSTLDFMGNLPIVQDLSDEGLLILPDVMPGSPSFPFFADGLPSWAPEQAAADSRQSGMVFGLPASNLLYTPRLPVNGGQTYPFIFTPLPDAPLTRWGTQRLIPVPVDSTDPTATADGLSLPARQTLLNNALAHQVDPSQGTVLVLGGSLPDSPFGDPQAAAATLRYIAAHPWIQPLNTSDLISLAAPNFEVSYPSSPIPASPPSSTPFIPSPLLANLPNPSIHPSNPLYAAAWQSAISLYGGLPPESPDLPALRAIYSDQTGVILEAARWADDPFQFSDCFRDPDLDGLPECVLASEQILAIFDLQGGRLIGLYSHTPDGVHQLIAPTSQLIVGLADPSTWDLTQQEVADPGQIAGAFADSPPPWQPYTFNLRSGRLTFTSPDGGVVKTFTLLANGLQVDIRSPGPLTLQIPIIIDPWKRFAPSWGGRYQGEISPEGYLWGLAGGASLAIRSSQELQVYPFSESLPQLRIAENPNYPYPRGHYLPFPVSLVEIQGDNHFFVELIAGP